MQPLPTDITIFHQSVIRQANNTFYLASQSGRKFLVVEGERDSFEWTKQISPNRWFCPMSPANASNLRTRFNWFNPVAGGCVSSFGFGDRIGLATHGHVKSVENRSQFPIFAQQSVRENLRTQRTPQQVMDAAMWGIMQSGWRQAWGADADHVKATADLPPFVAAGYTFFTIDPGDHVDDRAAALSGNELDDSFHSLPWEDLESSPKDLIRSMSGVRRLPEDLHLELDETIVARAAVKYGRAVAHAAQMARRLSQLMMGRSYDLEISIDETALPTTPQEHFYVAAELQRLGVNWVSLAPRFVGKFEKGVDYIGNLSEFRASLRWHAAIANDYGFYRLSLHSGSDKFSIYPILSEATGNKAHIKTAGTSLLEGLRVLTIVDRALFLAIYRLARERYSQDRFSYHVSAEVAQMPILHTQSEISPEVLDHFHIRQALHVTFGSMLEQFGREFTQTLSDHEDLYTATLVRHFVKHLDPFQ